MSEGLSRFFLNNFIIGFSSELRTPFVVFPMMRSLDNKSLDYIQLLIKELFDRYDTLTDPSSTTNKNQLLPLLELISEVKHCCDRITIIVNSMSTGSFNVSLYFNEIQSLLISIHSLMVFSQTNPFPGITPVIDEIYRWAKEWGWYYSFNFNEEYEISQNIEYTKESKPSTVIVPLVNWILQDLKDSSEDSDFFLFKDLYKLQRADSVGIEFAKEQTFLLQLSRKRHDYIFRVFFDLMELSLNPEPVYDLSKLFISVSDGENKMSFRDYEDFCGKFSFDFNSIHEWKLKQLVHSLDFCLRRLSAPMFRRFWRIVYQNVVTYGNSKFFLFSPYPLFYYENNEIHKYCYNVSKFIQDNNISLKKRKDRKNYRKLNEQVLKIIDNDSPSHDNLFYEVNLEFLKHVSSGEARDLLRIYENQKFKWDFYERNLVQGEFQFLEDLVEVMASSFTGFSREEIILRLMNDLENFDGDYYPLLKEQDTHIRRFTLTLPIPSLPDSIGQLKKLESCGINSPLTKLPNTFGLLVNLKFLYLSCHLSNLPKSFKQLKKLITLSLDCNQFSCIPEPIRYLDTLERLDLSDNPLEVLPKWLDELKNLEELDIYRTPLEKKPDFLPNLSNLVIRHTHPYDVSTRIEVAGVKKPIPAHIGKEAIFKHIKCPYCPNYTIISSRQFSGRDILYITCSSCWRSYSLMEELWENSYEWLYFDICPSCKQMTHQGLLRRSDAESTPFIECIACKYSYNLNS